MVLYHQGGCGDGMTVHWKDWLWSAWQNGNKFKIKIGKDCQLLKPWQDRLDVSEEQLEN